MKVRFIHPKDSNLARQGYSRAEEIAIYDKQLQDIIDNPRWYLDNLSFMRGYTVFWKDYSNKVATLPYQYVKKENVYK